MLFTVLAFIVALGLIITFHELGHYWVARWCGVRVLRFSVGFGQVVWQRTDKHGTEWAISAIPLGGYVKMLDEAEDLPHGADPRQAFNNKSVYQRFAIVAAGPLANLVLAVFLYAALAFAGTQAPAPIIAQPLAHTPAAQAGFQANDRITAIDGEAVQSWSDVSWLLFDRLASGGRVNVAVETASGRPLERQLDVLAARIEPEGSDPLADAGFALYIPQPLITEVQAGSAAEAAGLQAGDRILEVGEVANPDAAGLVQRIAASAGQPLALVVARNDTPLALTVIPQPAVAADGTETARIGVVLGADLPMVTVRYGVGGSIWQGLSKTADTVWFSLKMLGRMVVGDVSLRNISGPVTIADYAGQTARIGFMAYLGYLALISVSIGVLNLLPVPMLDGGHLMYYVIEIIRGRPLPERWLEAGQRIGLALLAGLMGLALLNDFNRLFS